MTNLLPALLALLAFATPAFAQTKAQSSLEDRQRFVSIVRSLESDPLNPDLRKDRAWAIDWLTGAPDVTVSACLDPLGGAPKKGYAHGPELIVQYMLAMAVFILENPTRQDDSGAQQLAGVEGALKTYQAIRTAEPNDKLPSFEKLLDLRRRGELPASVQKAYRSCKAKSGA